MSKDGQAACNDAPRSGAQGPCPKSGKKEYASTVEKGTEFEIQVAELFRSYGYKVTHDITLVGKSGAPHQIDVLAEYAAPLHATRIAVEAKAYSHNVVKDVIMKLANIRDDLGVERAVLATTKEFTSGALTTAAQYGFLDMWNGDKVNELMADRGIDTSGMGLMGAAKRFIPDKARAKRVRRNAAKSARRRSGGMLFRRGMPKERMAGVSLVSYPYLDVAVQTRMARVEKTGWWWRRKESVMRTVVDHVTLDGRTGALVDFAKNEMSYQYSYLGSVGRDEMAMLKQAAGRPTFGRNEIILSELSPGAANAVLLRLASRGIIKQVNEKPARYALRVPVPTRPSSVTGIDRPYGSRMGYENPGNRMIGLRVPVGSIEEGLGKIWTGCKVVSAEQVYYPYYDVRYESSDGGRRNEMVDGVTGRPQKYLAEAMAEDDQSLPAV